VYLFLTLLCESCLNYRHGVRIGLNYMERKEIVVVGEVLGFCCGFFFDYVNELFFSCFAIAFWRCCEILLWRSRCRQDICASFYPLCRGVDSTWVP